MPFKVYFLLVQDTGTVPSSSLVDLRWAAATWRWRSNRPRVSGFHVH